MYFIELSTDFAFHQARSLETCRYNSQGVTLFLILKHVYLLFPTVWAYTDGKPLHQPVPN